MQGVKMHPDWRQCIPCTVIECSGFYAAWPKASWLNAVDSMQRNWMQKIQCILAKWIPIVCSGVYAVRQNASDWMQWILCSMAQSIPIECSGFHAAWLNAVDSRQREEEMEPYWMQWILCSMIECSGSHAAWLNAMDFMQHGPKHPDWMQWIPSA